jgi:hypothetical protein
MCCDSEDGRIMQRLSSVKCINSYMAEDSCICSASLLGLLIKKKVIQNHCKAFDTPHHYLKRIISGALFA